MRIHQPLAKRLLSPRRKTSVAVSLIAVRSFAFHALAPTFATIFGFLTIGACLGRPRSTVQALRTHASCCVRTNAIRRQAVFHGAEHKDAAATANTPLNSNYRDANQKVGDAHSFGTCATWIFFRMACNSRLAVTGKLGVVIIGAEIVAVLSDAFYFADHLASLFSLPSSRQSRTVTQSTKK